MCKSNQLTLYWLHPNACVKHLELQVNVNTRTWKCSLLLLQALERASWRMKLWLPVALYDAPTITSITRSNSSGRNALSGMIQCIKACLFVLEPGLVQIYAQQLALLKFKCYTERFVARSHCVRSRKTNTAVLWINISTIVLKCVLNGCAPYVQQNVLRVPHGHLLWKATTRTFQNTLAIIQSKCSMQSLRPLVSEGIFTRFEKGFCESTPTGHL